MADNWKPIVWSTQIEQALKQNMVFANLCNRRHEKSAGTKTLGDTVKILGVARPTVSQITDYKATTGTPESPRISTGMDGPAESTGLPRSSMRARTLP